MGPAGAAMSAVGRLPGVADGAWVGVVPHAAGHALAFLEPGGRMLVEPAPEPRELLAAVIAWFEESLGEPPPELEATQEDLAAVVRSLARATTEPVERQLLVEALEGIEDGLAEDVVVRRLTSAAGAMRRETDEQADWVDLLVERYRVLRGA